MLGTKVYHFLTGSIPCALRALETDPRIAARKVATFGSARLHALTASVFKVLDFRNNVYCGVTSTH